MPLSARRVAEAQAPTHRPTPRTPRRSFPAPQALACAASKSALLDPSGKVRLAALWVWFIGLSQPVCLW